MRIFYISEKFNNIIGGIFIKSSRIPPVLKAYYDRNGLGFSEKYQSKQGRFSCPYKIDVDETGKIIHVKMSD